MLIVVGIGPRLRPHLVSCKQPQFEAFDAEIVPWLPASPAILPLDPAAWTPR